MRRRSYLPALACSFALLLALALVMNAVYDDGYQTKATAIGSITYLEEKLDELVFPKDKVIDVKVTIDEAALQDILNHAAAEEIKPASVEYNGIRLTNIGFRTKGNLSLMSVVNSDSDRYSFKLHLDEYISSQTLYGVRSINLNNSYSDPTYMREVLAYELAEQMGLPTPKYSYVNLIINDELWGLYLAVEQIGASYLERQFGDSTGSLYKAIQGAGTELAWVDDSRESYSGLVQKSDHADEEALIHMIYELNNGSDYEQVLDVENVLNYIALNVVTNNSDSYLGQNKHNYYLYERNGIFSILPWDYNMAFGGMGGMRFGGRGGRFGGNMSVFDPAGGRPLVDKLLAVPAYLELYTGYVRDALEGYLATDQFDRRVDEWADLIRDDVKRDPRPFYGYEQFESGIESLKSTNAENVARLMQELEQGVPTAPDRNQAAYDNSEIEANEVTIARFTGETAALARFQPDGGGNGPIPPGGMRVGQFPPFPTGDGQVQQDDNTNGQAPQDDHIDGQTQPNGDGQFPLSRMGNGQFPDFPGFPAGADGQVEGNFPAFGGGGFPGNRQGIASSTTISDEQLANEYAEIGISLGVMVLAAVFIVTFRRRRL